MKNILNPKILLLLLLLFCSWAFAPKALAAHNPKTANAFLRWSVSEDEAIALSRYDLLILDMEIAQTNPGAIKKIRSLNPDIKILAYVSSQEIRYDVYSHPEIPLRQKLFNQIPDNWYLRNDKGEKISFWHDTWMLNLSSKAPEYNGETFNDLLPRFIKEEILSSGLWDGIFFDNLFDSLNWLNNGNVDMDNDGLREDGLSLNRDWQAGVLELLKNARQSLGYDYIFMANSSAYDPYQPYLNGIMFENFPNPWGGSGNWSSVMTDYLRIKKLNNQPNYYVINSTNTGEENYVKMRYGLTSSLLFDEMYFSFDESIYDHGQTWYYDEYAFNLGLPLGSARTMETGDLWQREFQNGLVLLNLSEQERTIEIPEGYKKLYGTEDKVVNSGGELNRAIIGPKDGLVLEKINNLKAGVYKNYYHYRAYALDGKQLISGWQKGSDDYESGELISWDGQALFKKASPRTNYTKEKYPQRVEGSPLGKKPLVKIYNNKNKLIGIFKAYPDNYLGGVKITLGDVTGDGREEIIVLPEKGEPWLRVYSFKGHLIKEFYIGDKSANMSYDFFISDINNDKIGEIIATFY